MHPIHTNNGLKIYSISMNASIPHLCTWENLDGEPVSLAIAALAVGIVKAGGPVIDVASDLLQQMTRYSRGHGPICLHDPNQFIIPILISEYFLLPQFQTTPCGLGFSDLLPPVDEEDREVRSERYSICSNETEWVGGIGHWILVVAEKTDADVHFKISYSLNGNPKCHDIITNIITSIVQNSGWMANTQPIFRREWKIDVAQQLPGTNACGLHVILNGWAYLLNITPRKDWQPTLERYDEAIQLINMALHGRATAVDIETWLIRTNFAKYQSKEERAGATEEYILDRIMSAKTQAMNADLYAKYLEGRRDIESTIVNRVRRVPHKRPRSHVSNTDSDEDSDHIVTKECKTNGSTTVSGVESRPQMTVQERAKAFSFLITLSRN